MKMKSILIRLGLLAIIISVLAGCSGSDGSAGSTGIAGNLTKVTNLTAEQWQALTPTVDPASISVNMSSGAPVVKFKVTDANGNPLLGLEGQSWLAADQAAGLPHKNYNIAFTLAKLVTVTGGPSKWVTYLVTTPKAAGTSGGVVNGGVTWVGNFPQQDREGTLVSNGDGSYQYTFYRNITQTATIVSGLTDSGTSFKADLGDTTYDASLTHRLGIIISGSQPGTGTATPTAVQSVNPVPLVNTFNIGYDFVPNGGAFSATRDIVTKDSCTECHAGKGIGHVSSASNTNGVPPGSFVGRNDPRLCVTCHTDQIKYSFNNGLGDAPLNPDGITLTSTTAVDQAIIDGKAVGNFPNMIHKQHMGEDLIKQNYKYNDHAAGLFNNRKFPQDHRNCTKCHDGSVTKSDGTVNAKKTANGDNWMNVPSSLACGACHDGIKFSDGSGRTLGGLTTGHAGGAQANDSSCKTCHAAADIKLVHRATLATLNNPIVKTDVTSISFGITSVTVASGIPTITFQITKQLNGVSSPVTALAIPALVTNAKTGQQVIDPAYEPIPGFAGGPTFYVAYAVPQDGITAPADFNTYQSVALANLLIASGSPKAGSVVQDGAGNFVATLTGDLVGQAVGGGCVAPVAPAVATCVNTVVLASPIVIPATAKMVTGAVIGSFTQKVAPGYAPYVAANVSVNPNLAAAGGLNVPGLLKKLVATGYTARRVITDTSKCNACHDQLGSSPAFHGQTIGGELEAGTGVRNDPTACSICHNGSRTSSGWSADSRSFIHGVHGQSKRSVPYTWHAVSATDNFSKITYPGVLKNCNQCHLPDTVNYGVTGGADLQTKLVWSTTATGTFAYPATGSAVYTQSPYVATTVTTNYGNNFSYTPVGATVPSYTTSTGTVVPAAVAGAGGVTIAAEGTTLVTSPMSAACFACHDTALAKSHMTANGGSIYEARSTALLKAETCVVCHGKGRVADTAVIHQR